MAGNRGINDTKISDLPPEVLGHIFSYLPNNIRVIRLVCSQWNEVCNVRKVSGHEYVFLCGYDRRLELDRTEDLEKFFNTETLSRNIYNLHLQSITFTADHVPFFEKFGSELRSLTLHDCHAAECVPFLQFCKKLDTVKFEYCSADIVQLCRRLDGSLIQTNVVSLKIIDYGWWSDETVDACFRICPQLRSLTWKRQRRRPLSISRPPNKKEIYSFKDDEERVLNRSDIISFDCIYYALSIRAANIVALNLDDVRRLSPEQVERIVSIPDLKLQKLKLSGISRLTQTNICNIVALQPDMQDITIHWCEITNLRLNELANWIEKCSKLTRLEIQAYWSFVFDGKLLNALASRLNLRELWITTLDSTIGSDFINNKATLNHLQTLRLSLRNIDYDCILAKVSVNLQHLNVECVGGISCQTLAFISNRFTNLRTLEFSMESPGQFSGCEQISFGNFERLSILRIGGPLLEYCPPGFFEHALKAPNLLTIELNPIDHVEKLEFPVLCQLVNNYPLLECFKMWSTMFDVKPCDACIMRDWKKLSHFYYDDSEQLELHRCEGNEDKFEFVADLTVG